jgi:DNA polymerase I-like protein with 3'-5' exonuclease and polymerase domains
MISSNVILDLDTLKRRAEYFAEQDAFVFDVETVGKHRGVAQQNQVTWLAMTTHGNTMVIPMGHPNGNTMLAKPTRKKRADGKFDMAPAKWDEPPEQLRPSQVFSALEPLYMDPSIIKIAHGATFDLLSVVKYFGGIPKPPYGCTIVADWLLNENKLHGLKPMTIARYKRKYDKENVGRRVEIHPFNKVAGYAFMDSRYTWLHRNNLMPRIHAEGLDNLWQLEMDILEVLLDMGVEGVDIDVPKMQRLEEELSVKKVEDEGKIYVAAGKKFNINSNKQKVEVLYSPKKEGGQGLKPWRLTKGGLKKDRAGEELQLTDYSTDKEALGKFWRNPVVTNLLAYQEVTRVHGTYLQSYLGVEGNPKKPGMIFDGKVYPDFPQYGTVTGRFSGREPNLQNLPRATTELGREVRSLFYAPDGFLLARADYAQIEMMVLAHFCAPGALRAGLLAGVNAHIVTASTVFEVRPEDVKPEQYDTAKNIGFAVVYGAWEDKIAAMSKMTVKRAREVLRKHENEFPEIYDFKDDVVRVCKSRKPPHVKTLLGRKRRLPEIWASDWSTKNRAERQAVNSVIQGTAADLIKMAMIRVHRGLARRDSGRLILTVHDELIVKAREEKAEEAARILTDAMIGPGIQKWIDVPLKVDLAITKRWSDVK